LLADALRGYVKTILGSAASKTAVAAVVATASVGGVVFQQALAEGEAPPAATPIGDRVSPPASSGTSVQSQSSAARVSRPVSSSEHGRGDGAAEVVTVTSSRPSLPGTRRREEAPPTATAPVVTPPETGDTSSTTTEQKDTVVLPKPPLPQAPPLPRLPPVPEPGPDDQLVPSVKVPPLPPLPELPPAEVPLPLLPLLP
jgi:hypothetical protein